MKTDNEWMELACKEAEKATGLTSPNPIVGAVAVKDGKLLSSGYHHKAGSGHAEVECLKKNVDFKGATLYVTLEPCSTHGRTPPCTEAVITAGISKVVIGTLDPNPSHAGRAVKILQDKGLEVIHGVLKERCWNLNLSFFKWIRDKKPLVILKMAMTLDGKIATKSGKSQWITGPESRQKVQDLRKAADAIMVGGETVRLDDPSLIVKEDNFDAQPQRYIWSSQTDWNENLKCFANDGKSAKVIKPTDPQEWQTVLEKMGQNQITSLLIEGGGELAASALDARIVDVVYFFIAPKILLGRDSRPVIGGESPDSLAAALELENIETEKFGNDILIKGFLSDIWKIY